MWHLATDFVAFATSLGTSNRPFAEALDGLRPWDTLNPKRYTDGSLKRLCEPTWLRLKEKAHLINGGVMGGSPARFYREDAQVLLPQLQGDILYLDPPYAKTVSYERSNEVLDALLAGEKPIIRPEVSAFSKDTAGLESLFKAASHIPVWLLSYGSQVISLKDLQEIICSVADDRVVVGFTKSHRHLAHVSKTENNQEFLVLAYPKGGYSLCP